MASAVAAPGAGAAITVAARRVIVEMTKDVHFMVDLVVYFKRQDDVGHNGNEENEMLSRSVRRIGHLIDFERPGRLP